MQARPAVPNCAGRSRSLSIDFSRLRGAMRCANLPAPREDLRARRGAVLDASAVHRSQSSCTGEFRARPRPKFPVPACAAWAVSAPLHRIPLARSAGCVRPKPGEAKPPGLRPYRPRLAGPESTQAAEARPYIPRLEGAPGSSEPRPYIPRLEGAPGSSEPKPYTPFTYEPGPAQNATFTAFAPGEASRDWAPDGPWVRFLVWWETWIAPHLPFSR